RIIFLQGLLPKTKFVALRIFHLPWLNGRHLDIEIQSFARERVIKIKNNCFFFHLMDLDNNILSLWSADAEGIPTLSASAGISVFGTSLKASASTGRTLPPVGGECFLLVDLHPREPFF